MAALGPNARPWSGSGPTLTGHVLEGRYELLAPLGRGGMAEVYKAYFIPGGTHHAVKLLRRGSAADEALARRFAREFKALHQLDHEGIVRAHDFGHVPDGRPYFVMELLEGETLHDLLERAPRLDPARAVRLTLQVCEALEALHDAGIVHRDLKPGNLFIQDGDRVKLIDLGIARLTDAYYARDGRYVTPPSQRIRTPRAHILGTPGYIAPETRQERAGPRADVFSLGVVLYRMLTGSFPFEASDTNYTTPAPGALDTLPRALQRAVRTAIEIEADERYQSVRELHMELEDALLDVTSDSELRELDVERLGPVRQPTRPRARRSTVFVLGAFFGAAAAGAIAVASVPAAPPPSVEPSFIRPVDTHDAIELEDTKLTTEITKAMEPEPFTSDPSDSAPVDPAPEAGEVTAAKATGSDSPRKRRHRVPDSFQAEMNRARPAMAACLRFLPSVEEVAIPVRVRAGVSTITRRSSTPASIRRCLERAIAPLDFGPGSFSATYRMKP